MNKHQYREIELEVALKLLDEKDAEIEELRRATSRELGGWMAKAANLGLVVDHLRREKEVYRQLAINYRTLWGELVQPTGRYHDMPVVVDDLAQRLLKEGSDKRSESRG